MRTYICPERCSEDLSGYLIQPSYPISGEPILFICGEAPGEEEEKHRRFFVGKTGQEMDNYLNRIGVPRSKCYVSNVLKCRPPGNRDPKQGEVEICSQVLRQELDEVRPRFIAAIGRFATQFFLGDVNMEMVHGIPYRVQMPWGTCIVIPVYHPAAGLHDTTNMSNIMSDFLAVKQAMMRQIEIREPGRFVAPPPYHVLEMGEDPTPYLTDLVATDTETQDKEDTPWCLQFCCGGQGHVIMRDNTQSLRLFADWVAQPWVLNIIHNSLFDIKVAAMMGVRFSKFVDTMVMAYLLQTEPQGLKPLTFRHLGVKMDEYQDITDPRTQEMALDYLMRVSEEVWPKLPPVLEMKAGKPHIRQPQTINQKVNRMIKDVLEGKDVDLYDRWHKTQMADGRGMVEEKWGEMKRAYLKDVEWKRAMQYAATDPWATFRIYPVLKKKIDALDLNETLDRDMQVIPMVETMQRVGMPINPPYFVKLQEEFTTEMDTVNSDITKMVGDIHPGSDPQVLALVERLGLFKAKRKWVGGKEILIRKKAVDVASLTLMEDKHPVIPRIMRWRALSKLVDSFINVLLEKKGEDNRIRTTLRVTRVITGRLASSNPNLMAQPVRSEDGRRIRGGFEAPEGFEFVSGDQSQIEMRVIAHISQDPRLLDIFRTGKDIHAFTASNMFHLPIDQLDEMKHRYPAKRVGFGILNLISAGKLQKELTVGGAGEWTEAQCQTLIDDWFSLYSKVADYVEERKAEARRTGMVRDLAGRIRLIPEVMSVHRKIQEEGVRYAVNGPIQMGAQAVEKQAMIACRPIYEELFSDGSILPLIQVHDDVVWQIRSDIIPVAISLIRDAMEHCMDDRLSVPLKVDFKRGKTWEKMEKVK